MGAGAIAGCKWIRATTPINGHRRVRAVAGETEVVVDVLRLLSPEEEATPAA